MNIKELKQFAVEVAAIKAKAGQIGLFKTMQKLEPAVQQVGWEIAEIMGRKKNERETY